MEPDTTQPAAAGGDTPVEEIPGIGVIRARSLRKAGYGTLAALRGLTAEQLAAVPGITAAKAEQIVAFVASLPASVAENPTEPAAEEATPLQRAAFDLSSSARKLLHSGRADDYESRLAKQLGKLALVADRLSADRRTAHAAQKVIAEQLAKLKQLLLDTAEADKLGHRKQEKLADRLRSGRKELQRRLGADTPGEEA